VQSSNEELATVNDELNHRNAELARANNDLVNLLSSVQMAIVMIDPGLCIRRFTPLAEKMLNLIPADVGRPIRDLNLSISVPDLGRHLEEVIDTVGPKEFEVQDRQGRWHLLRLRPYRTVENKIDGAVMVFVDIDSLKRDEQMLRQQAELLDRVRDPILMWELDGPIIYWNKAAEETYGYPRSEALKRRSSELLSGFAAAPEIEESLRKKGIWTGELAHVHRDGRKIRVDSRMSLVREADGRLLVTEANHVIGEETPRG
jgi:two-component system CheB/CheR fusion protein